MNRLSKKPACPRVVKKLIHVKKGNTRNSSSFNSHTSPFAHMLADETFREGFAEIGKRGLSFDAWLYHPQIPELTDLARAFPDTSIVLNHVGGPLGIGPYEGKGEEVFKAWCRDISALAQCPNVSVKLDGLLMSRTGLGFHQEQRPPSSDEIAQVTGRYYRHAIECFGVERCMFESNFPVDGQSCSYPVLWNAFKKIVADATDSDKSALFHDTATRFCQLDRSEV